MSSESPIEIPPPDSMQLSAATGWMQLGNTDEALLDLDKISDRLIEAGRAPDEPVAVVSRATLPDQTVVVTTLTECASEVAKVKPKPPNIVVVGPIVDMRNVIGWWNE